MLSALPVLSALSALPVLFVLSVLSVLSAPLVPLAKAEIYLVQADGSGDFPTIAEAVAQVTDGDIIELADGLFSGDGNRDVDLGGKLIIVRSQSDRPEACMIDCEGSPTEQHRAFYLNAGETLDTRIEGMTIRGGWQKAGGGIAVGLGSAVTIRNCVFEANGALGVGGALHSTGTCVVTGCIFRDNASQAGSAIAANGPITMSGTTVHDNEAEFAAGLLATGGGHVLNCTFADNRATLDGNIVKSMLELLELENCIIAENLQGGAVYCCCDGDMTLTCCNLYGNEGGDWVDCGEGQLGQNGNISQDPRFCRDALPETPYALSIGSPCCEDQQSECGRMGAWPIGCDDTTVTPVTWGAMKSLFQH